MPNPLQALRFDAMARALLAMPRSSKRVLTLLTDAVAVSAALWAAFALKEGSWQPLVPGFPALALVAVFAALPLFAYLGLYRAVVRFIGPHAMYAVIGGAMASTMGVLVYDRLQPAAHVPVSVAVIYAALTLLYVGGTRFAVRQIFHSYTGRKAERVAIYGAGEAGARLSTALIGGAQCQPVVFLDDKRAIQGNVINGLTVAAPDTLPTLVQDLGITGVLLAIPSASRRRKKEILSALEPLGLHVRTMPDMADILSGRARLDDIRDVDVADLLGRDPVPPDPELFDACVRGKVVLVTGAGGSIGSELCRQIVGLAPRTLVLFENSEHALYQIEKELIATIHRGRLGVELVALLGNAHHRERVTEVMSTYRIQTVYHAAAYKHVPIVERNVIEGVYNNVLATWHTAEAALEAQVETFVLVSTDKAVNPTNVMGATKRVAEIVLQGLHQRSQKTRFCMVRFGNVLASSGSVVPLFREQIRSGGPLTVTHPDVTRYFMTIPEAAQLVIQAGSMARGGDVFVLDMGKPVRIDELARRLIGLMGMTVRDERNPEGDIEIVYTGLRPAEKLYEELLIGNNVSGTDHPSIMRAVEHALPWEAVERILVDVRHALRTMDTLRVLQILEQAVVEYKPSTELHDLVTIAKSLAASEQRKVTTLAARRPRQGLN